MTLRRRAGNGFSIFEGLRWREAVCLRARRSCDRERFDDEITAPGEDATSLSTEGVVRVEWAMFRFDSPKLDLLTTLHVFPSISDAGRVRSDADLRVEYEVIKDFFLSVTVFLTGDSRPPSADATKRDFGSSITLGWSF